MFSKQILDFVTTQTLPLPLVLSLCQLSLIILDTKLEMDYMQSLEHKTQKDGDHFQMSIQVLK